MNKTAVLLLKSTRRVCTILCKTADRKCSLTFDLQGQQASDSIRKMLTGNEPCMICRFGSYELRATLNYLDVTRKGSSFSKTLKYIKGEIGPYWWDDEIAFFMRNNAGFFPANAEFLSRFANIVLKDIQNIDILGSWLIDEARLENFLPKIKRVPLLDLEPFYHSNPWSEGLEGKRVLVVHPFEKTITKQYEKRRLLFDNPRTLPNFELMTLKAVQSNAGSKSGFSSWFDALEHMSKKVSVLDFDVAIIGAGAYGLHLASYVKGMGKKAVHMGGATQLLFGIKGKRWDDAPFYRELYNDNWTRPLPEETPANYEIVEGGCYW